MNETQRQQVLRLVKPIADDRPCGHDGGTPEDLGPGTALPPEELPTVALLVSELVTAWERSFATQAGSDSTLLTQGVIRFSPWRKKAENILSRASKHIQVAKIWMLGMMESARWEGLEMGLILIAELLERYPKELHPLPEDGDPYERVGLLDDLAASVHASRDPFRVLLRIQLLPLFEVSGFGEISWAHLCAAKEPSASLLPSSWKLPSASQIQNGWRGLDVTAVDRLRSVLGACKVAIDRIEAAFSNSVSSAFGSPGEGSPKPGAGPALGDLVSLLKVIENALTSRGELAADSASPFGAGIVPEAAVTARGVPAFESGGALTCREDVLRRLKRIEGFFRDFEPSSPVRLLVERASSMAQLDFLDAVAIVPPEALKELGAIFGGDPTKSNTASIEGESTAPSSSDPHVDPNAESNSEDAMGLSPGEITTATEEKPSTAKLGEIEARQILLDSDRLGASKTPSDSVPESGPKVSNPDPRLAAARKHVEARTLLLRELDEVRRYLALADPSTPMLPFLEMSLMASKRSFRELVSGRPTTAGDEETAPREVKWESVRDTLRSQSVTVPKPDGSTGVPSGESEKAEKTVYIDNPE